MQLHVDFVSDVIFSEVDDDDLDQNEKELENLKVYGNKSM